MNVLNAFADKQSTAEMPDETAGNKVGAVTAVFGYFRGNIDFGSGKGGLLMVFIFSTKLLPRNAFSVPGKQKIRYLIYLSKPK